MVTLIKGLAGNFKDGSEQMAANVAVLPLSIWLGHFWMLISAKFYNTPIRLKDTFGLNRGRVKHASHLALAGGSYSGGDVFDAAYEFVVNALADEVRGKKLVTVIAEPKVDWNF